MHPDDAPSLRLPAAVSPSPPLRVPIVGALAPVVVSLALFAATGSAPTLLFSALGPVAALAGLADSGLAGIRHRRRERRRFARELVAAEERLAAEHGRERAVRRLEHPGGPGIAAVDPRATVRWRRPGAASPALGIGSGTVRSGLAVEGDRSDPTVEGLARRAGRLADAPVLAPAESGVGVCGPLPLARAVARGIAAQALAAIGPDRARLLATGPAWADALDALPHARDPDPGRGRADSVLRLAGADGDLVRIAVAADPVDLAPLAAAVVDTGAAVLRAGGAEAPVRVEPVDLEAFTAWCLAVGDAARELGATGPGAEPPVAVGLGELLPHRPRGAASAVLGSTAEGPLLVDLAADGPHAVVGGTTGSGKSELLVSWIAAMAAGAAPEELALLLVDFKGGAGFAPVAGLPHVVGVVTDLDEAGALRAVGSLRAEVRRREAALAEAGLREHEPGLGLPRLVIVVDEYAALVDAHPALHEVFADLAARGRSLGIHLLVGTQRPSASVRDAVLANADVRISLRVRDRADGIALVGSAAPAELPAEPRGRAIASVAGRPPVAVQVALASVGDVAAIGARWAGAPRPRRPWRDPLPPRIAPEALPGLLDEPAPPGVAAIGAIDRPELQAVLPWCWRPGGLDLVLGAPGSGRTGVLGAIAAAAPALVVPAEPAAAWDAVEELAASTGDHGGLAVLVDDLDRLAERLDPEHRAVLLDRLAAIARASSRLGLGLVVTAAGIGSAVRALEPVARSRVLLRMPSRHEHLLAGGDGAGWDPRLPPGAAIVDGRRAQAVVAPLRPPAGRVRTEPLPQRPLAVLAASPAATAARLGSAGRRVLSIEEALAALARGALDPTVAVVADPTAWQARWGALETVAPATAVVAVGLDPTRLGSATGLRALPPPLPDEDGWCWLLHDGAAVRARLP